MPAVTLKVPCGSTVRGTMTTALFPARICWATPVVLAADSTQTSIGPFGPVNDAVGAVAVSGIMAMIGSPAEPDHPQNVNGFGDSTTKRSRLVVAPFPGKTIGAARCGAEPKPRMTSRVAPECHVGVSARSHLPNPVDCRFGRNTPIAWNGPLIHSSMWLRALVLITLETATFPLLPASSPSGV